MEQDSSRISWGHSPSWGHLYQESFAAVFPFLCPFCFQSSCGNLYSFVIVNGTKERVRRCVYCRFAIRETQLQNPQTPSCKWINGEICPFCLNTNKDICCGLGESVKKYRVGHISTDFNKVLLDVCLTPTSPLDVKSNTKSYSQFRLYSFTPTCQISLMQTQKNLGNFILGQSKLKIRDLTKETKQTKAKLYKNLLQEIQKLSTKSNEPQPQLQQPHPFEEKALKIIEFITGSPGSDSLLVGEYSDLRFLQALEPQRLLNTCKSMTINCLLSQWATRLINTILESLIFILLPNEKIQDLFGTTVNDVVRWLPLIQRHKSKHKNQIFLSKLPRNVAVFFSEQLHQIKLHQNSTASAWLQIATVELQSFLDCDFKEKTQQIQEKTETTAKKKHLDLSSQSQVVQIPISIKRRSNQKKAQIRHAMMKKLRKCPLCKDPMLNDDEHCFQCQEFFEGKPIRLQSISKEKQAFDCELCEKQARYCLLIEKFTEWVHSRLEKERDVHQERKKLYEEAYTRDEVLKKEIAQQHQLKKSQQSGTKKREGRFFFGEDDSNQNLDRDKEKLKKPREESPTKENVLRNPQEEIKTEETLKQEKQEKQEDSEKEISVQEQREKHQRQQLELRRKRMIAKHKQLLEVETPEERLVRQAEDERYLEIRNKRLIARRDQLWSQETPEERLRRQAEEKRLKQEREIDETKQKTEKERFLEEQRTKNQILPIDLLKELMAKAPFGTLDDLKACLVFPEMRKLIPTLKWVKLVNAKHQGMGGFQYKEGRVEEELRDVDVEILGQGMNWLPLNGLLKWKEFYGDKRNVICIGNLTSDPLDQLKINARTQPFVVSKIDVIEFVEFV